MNRPAMKFRPFLFLFLFFLPAVTAFFFSGTASATPALPDIPEPVELKMHSGTAEEALAFIEQRQKKTEELAADSALLLDQSVNMETKETDIREALTNAGELFREAVSQLQRLKAEWKKSAETYIKPPQLGQEPYSLTLFNEIRVFQKEVHLHLGQCTRNIEALDKRLATLKNNIDPRFADYSRLKQKKEDRPFALEKSAYIFSMQAKYSLLALRQSRLKKQKENLAALEEQGSELIQRTFEHLNILQEELAKRKKEKEQALLEQERLAALVQKKTNRLDSELLQSEVDLEKLEENRDKTAENLHIQDLLKVEQRRLASKQETLNVERSGFEQEKLKQKISTLMSVLVYAQVRYYADEKQEEPADKIQYWSEKQEEFQGTYKSVGEELLLLSRQKNQVQQNFLLAEDELENTTDQKVRNALAKLKKQLDEEQELLDSAIAALLDNQQNLKALLNEINWYLDFRRNQMPWYTTLSVDFEQNLRKFKDNALEVVYHPLFSFSQVEVNLAVILKFIFLLLLGLLLLRLTRNHAVKILEKNTRMSHGSVNSLTTLGYYLALAPVFFIVLSALGINLTQLTVIFGALGIGIGFGLQTIMNNFISGIILLAERAVRTGDIVNLESGVTGEVKKVAIRSTIIRTVNGDDIIVPNSEFVSGRVNTWTYSDDWRRLTVPFGVSYASDPDEIVRLATETAREVDTTREDKEHPIRIVFEGYGESSLDFSIRVWCRIHQLQAFSGLRSPYYFVLFRKLQEAGVEIPFPQRDLHLRSVAPQAAALFRQPEKQETEKTEDNNPQGNSAQVRFS
ncbi:MAG: mechanosensitive ion channel domain-containing protein [Candidatus Electrothrix sp. YB6]